MKEPDARLLCSACDPSIGVWHGRFNRKSAEGYLVGGDGFLYHEEEVKKITHTKMVGRIVDGVVSPLEDGV